MKTCLTMTLFKSAGIGESPAAFKSRSRWKPQNIKRKVRLTLKLDSELAAYGIGRDMDIGRRILSMNNMILFQCARDRQQEKCWKCK